jgi:FAD/FMN-containing dehydrogenase
VSLTVNDVHSRLNEASVAQIVRVESPEDVVEGVRNAKTSGRPIAIAAGRHAMGGQQFCCDGTLLDVNGLNRLLTFDPRAGTVEVEAGIQWPALIDALEQKQEGHDRPWTIAQKQTGADRLSIGGALSANAHGRGLAMAPFVSDVESIVLIDANGAALRCSRAENADLFSLVAGGYGLFGCITSVTLRLVRRVTLERVVEIRTIDGLTDAFDERRADGFLYGDFQFATDEASDDFLSRGVFSCYRPVPWKGSLPPVARALSRELWDSLILLAHTDKARAFDEYSRFYLSTNGQLYLSDRHQLADYADGYHERIDVAMNAAAPATEMITEVYVPRTRLAEFMGAVAEDCREYDTNVIYGTVRLIEPDRDSFLPWATNNWACVIFNLCTTHTEDGIHRSIVAFRRLIDRATSYGGSFFLTYHRWATREQLERCYPRFREFLAAKLAFDPSAVFQSDWYRHYRSAFDDETA